MMNIQLKSSWQFIFKGNCTSTFRSFYRIKRYTHNIIAFREYPRPYVLSIVECYQKRIALQQHYVSEHETLSIVPRKDDVFHVVLTARPDEFHKLPPKCSACGEIFQTKHDNRAGYINEKKFLDSLKTGVTDDKLVCFNCFRLRYHNSPVLKGVDSIDAMNQIHHLREQKALILYVVDLFDIEGTMLSNILQLVGDKKRIIIVGNKLDRIPLDHQKAFISKQFAAMKSAVKDIAFKNGLNESCNFRDICLVSAKTGFGVKTLVEKINEHRDKYMNVYLVGCTNTGKSMLYNLLVNLINVHKPNDLPAQAIEHPLPGTTRSLVRERISQSKLRKLVKRLEKGPYVSEDVFNFDGELLDLLNVDNKDERYQIMGTASKKDYEKLRLFGQGSMAPRPVEIVDEKYIDKEEKSCFIYDTPGILNTSQLIQYLTPSEINFLSPSLWVVPRTFLLKPGYCICVGGLARLDFLSITRPPLIENGGAGKVDLSRNDLPHSGLGIYVTAMVSPNVPIHVTTSQIAKEKYETWFSNNFFKFPVGSPERFKDFPKLMQHDYTILGKSRNTNACDLVLHGIGWLSVAAVWGSKVCLALHTPNGDGQNLRHRPFLPYTVQKKQGRGVMYYGHLNRSMYGHTRKRSPQLIKVLEDKNETPDTIKIWKAKINAKMKRERFQKKEDERLERIEQGIILGKRKVLMEKVQKFRLLEEQNHSKFLEIKK